MTIQVKKKLRNNEYYNFQKILDDLYIKAKTKNFKTNKLYSLIISKQNILLALSNLKNNSCSKIPGIDKKTIDDYLKMKYTDLERLILNKLRNYQPRKIKRVVINNPDGKIKSITVPCMIDRIIQMMFLNILEPICEAKFYKYSYGFRPNRTVENALLNLNQRINQSKLYYIVNISIKSFLNNIDCGKLLKQIWSLGIQDKTVISIISRMLKLNIIDFSDFYGERGIFGGEILTPLFINIALNELDWWVANQWENFPVTSATLKYRKDGTEHKSDLYRSLQKSKRSQNMKECFIVRYSDDFKIFCKKRSDAIKMFYATKDFLYHRLHIEIDEDKSGVINIKKKSINFLGFQIRTKKQQAKRTNIVVQTNICDEKKKEIKIHLRKEYKRLGKIINKFEVIKNVNQLNLYIIGLHNYFKYATNVNLDFNDINFETMKYRNNRLRKRLSKNGVFLSEQNMKTYGKSKQVRWLDGIIELVPVGYVQNQYPMALNHRINKYTEDGRKMINKKVKPEIRHQIHLMQSYPIQSRSVEYSINRITKYSDQNGECFVTGRFLLSNELHCHHIIPISLGGDDSLNNLVILHEDIHRLIHLVDSTKIENKLKELNLTSNQLKKINNFRKKSKLNPIKKLNKK